MPKVISISSIASEIAKSLSMKHNKEIAYKTIIQNNFYVMLGFCVEPNRFNSSEFSVRYFIQPLYIPTSYINLSLGDKIDEWEKTDLQEALSKIQNCFKHYLCIDSIDTIIDKVNNYQLLFLGSPNNKYELLAYSYLAINEYDNAVCYLDKIIALENKENATWYKVQIERAKKVLNLINNEQWEEIKVELLMWQKETITKLHLSDK